MQKVMTKFGVMQVTRHNVTELQFMHSCWLTGYVCLLSMVDLHAMTKAVHVTIFHLMSMTLLQGNRHSFVGTCELSAL
jgi:hypothetical protein